MKEKKGGGEGRRRRRKGKEGGEGGRRRREGRYDERVERWTERVTSSKILTKSTHSLHH